MIHLGILLSVEDFPIDPDTLYAWSNALQDAVFMAVNSQNLVLHSFGSNLTCSLSLGASILYSSKTYRPSLSDRLVVTAM